MSEATAHDARDRVGPYLLIRAIGAGGSARVDLARIDRAYNFQRHVVIKRPLEHLRADAAVAASLRREARIGGRLRHPNLVAVLDAGVHDGYDYLALEYIHGTSLRALMQTEASGLVREIPLVVALGIAVDVCRALHAAHELADEHGAPLGLVHRDVSPGNVLLGRDGAVKLADFGIAKETRVATLSGSLHGTVTYMAPEQCRGHAFDRRADIFSIGVILYELATRQRLFWADNDVASLHRVLSGQVTPPRQLDPAISPALEQLVMTAIAHQPEQRFASARQLADAIEGLAAAAGHVLGARWLARTLEEEIGAKHAPWIAATTLVQMLAPADAPAPPPADAPAPPPADESLVDLIRQTPEPDEPIYPTFGPNDERSIEEGSVPSAAPQAAAITTTSQRAAQPPQHGSAAQARPRMRWMPIVLGGLAVGVIAAFAISGARRHAAPSPTTASPAASSAPPAASPAPTPPPAAGPTPSVAGVPAASIAGVPAAAPAAGLAPEIVIGPTRGRRRAKHKSARSHQTSAPAAGSDRGPAVTDQPPATAATPPPARSSSAASHSPPPAWDRSLLLPSDGSGAGSAAQPAKTP